MKITVNEVKEVSKDNYRAKPRIYVWADNDHSETILDQMITRRFRPYKIYKKAMPEIFKKVGITDPDAKVNWSQKAGCSCGCSPGFIFSGYGLHNDLHVSVHLSEN